MWSGLPRRGQHLEVSTAATSASTKAQSTTSLETHPPDSLLADRPARADASRGHPQGAQPTKVPRVKNARPSGVSFKEPNETFAASAAKHSNASTNSTSRIVTIIPSSFDRLSPRRVDPPGALPVCKCNPLLVLKPFMWLHDAPPALTGSAVQPAAAPAACRTRSSHRLPSPPRR